MIIIAVYDSNRTGGAHDNDENRLTSLEQFRSMFLDMTYPVGAIYMSVNATSPATLFGGAWEAISGRFLIGTNSSYTPGSTGGSTAVSHTHQHGVRLGGFYSSTTFENNSGTHGAISWDSAGNKSIPGYTRVSAPSTKCNSAAAQSLATYEIATYDLIGNTSYTSVSTMPPYLAVYMWKRTA